MFNITIVLHNLSSVCFTLLSHNTLNSFTPILGSFPSANWSPAWMGLLRQRGPALTTWHLIPTFSASLASDWLRVITWPGYWPLIGWYPHFLPRWSQTAAKTNHQSNGYPFWDFRKGGRKTFDTHKKLKLFMLDSLKKLLWYWHAFVLPGDGLR